MAGFLFFAALAKSKKVEQIILLWDRSHQ